jgi:multidrug resistance efflux pump
VSAAFSRTMRSLSVDGARRPLGPMALGAVLLGLWAVWCVRARVDVWETTATARLEVGRAVHHVDAPAAGRLVAMHLTLGRAVAPGDLLAELDVERERLQLREQEARLAAVAPQLDALGRELAAEARGVTARREANQSALREAQARHREAEALARLAAEEATRTEALAAQHFVADMDAARARAEAQSRRAGAEALALAITRMEREHRAEETARLARVARLESELARLQGERETAAAAIASFTHQIARRSVRAPVAGRIGRLTEVRQGSVVQEGQRLADLVPEGALRVVARFPAAVAVGRIRVGQPARVRLAGFPWAVYGTLPATVARVAAEPQEGTLRVELDVGRAPSTIPLQHGLQGAVEVRVERLSPATILLRAAGRRLAGEADPSAPTPQPAGA